MNDLRLATLMNSVRRGGNREVTEVEGSEKITIRSKSVREPSFNHGRDGGVRDYVLPGNQAYAYPISVGRDGFTWTGTEKISRIVAWPSWTPPPE